MGFFAKQFKISNMPIKMRMQCALMWQSTDLCMSALNEVCIMEIISVFKKVPLHYLSCVQLFDIKIFDKK